MKLTKLFIVALVIASPSAFAGGLGVMAKSEVRDGQMRCDMNFATKDIARMGAPAAPHVDGSGESPAGRDAR
jgi:hypothetical protein